MMNHRWSKSKAAATVVLGLCLVAFVMLDEQSYTSQYLYDDDGQRRSLAAVNSSRKLRRQENNRRLKEQRRVQRLQKMQARLANWDVQEQHKLLDRTLTSMQEQHGLLDRRLTRTTSDGFNENSAGFNKETLDMDIDTKSDNEPSLQERLANLDILFTRTSAAFNENDMYSAGFNDEQDVEERGESSLVPLSASPDPDLGTALFWDIPESELQEEQSLDEEGSMSTEDGIHSWAETNLVPLSKLPDPDQEIPLFWHIPKSGGSTAKEFFRCTGKRIEVLSRPDQIKLAQERDLIPSRQVDIVFSSFPVNTISGVFNEEHRGRMMAMFRHPVDRLVSKFFYLQIATWENTYRPEWKELTLMDWAQRNAVQIGANFDNDHYVKTLAGKDQMDIVTVADLELAKHTVKSYIIVGLMDRMEGSMNRFNLVLGIDHVKDKKLAQCTNEYFPGDEAEGKKTNSNPHPKLEKDDPAYQLLAEQNCLDIQLYEYIEEIYVQQKDIIESYKLGNTSDEVPQQKEFIDSHQFQPQSGDEAMKQMPVEED